MKKAVTLVGISAMVLMLGLGSGLAQQSTSKESTAVPAVTQVTPSAPADLAKEKALPAKPGFEVKAEKAAPVTPSVAKEANKAATTKAAVDTKAEKAAAAGKATEKAGTVKDALAGKTDKSTAAAKPALDSKVDQAKPAGGAKAVTTDAAKSTVEKAPEKVGDVKVPVKP